MSSLEKMQRVLQRQYPSLLFNIGSDGETLQVFKRLSDSEIAPIGTFTAEDDLSMVEDDIRSAVLDLT